MCPVRAFCTFTSRGGHSWVKWLSCPEWISQDTAQSDVPFVSHNRTWELADIWRKSASQNDSFLARQTEACQESFFFFFLKTHSVCAYIWLVYWLVLKLVYVRDSYVCVRACLLKRVENRGCSVCCVHTHTKGCVPLCMCIAVKMPPPYYSWLVDGCWLSHLPDFVPARCGGVMGKAPKHSSISTTVQHFFGPGRSIQYPFSRSRYWQKCLHTQKQGDQTYWPALWVAKQRTSQDQGLYLRVFDK